MIIKATKKNLEQRLKERSSEYLSEIEPAIVKRHDDGSFDCDTEHPAWKAAMVKYKPVRKPRVQKCPQAVAACCGDPYGCGLNPGMDCPDPYNQKCDFRIKIGV